MIDDKKIENAAFEYGEGISFEAFIDGAEWMQKEFLKDLWHPIEEKPERNTPYLAQLLPASPFETSIPFETFSDSELFERYLKDKSIIRWCYIDDLFPKQKGK